MPMIDVYATAGTFADKHTLAVDLATTLMGIEAVPNIPMFRQNTAGFVHELPAGDLSNVDGESNYVRVQVLTNAGALDRDMPRLWCTSSRMTERLCRRTWSLLLPRAAPPGSIWVIRPTYPVA